MRLTGQTVIGIIIIFIGLNILSSTLHLPFSFGQLFVPLLFFLLGGYFWQNNNRMTGGILALIGLVTLANQVFDVNTGGLIIAVLMIYFGFRLFQKDRTTTKKKEEKWGPEEEEGQNESMFNHHHRDQSWSNFEEDIDREIEKISHKVKSAFQSDPSDHRAKSADRASKQTNDSTGDHGHHQTASDDHQPGHGHHQSSDANTTAHQFKKAFTSHWKSKNRHVQQVSSFLGDFIQQDHFELNDMQISHFIGDVKIDLSKALIPEGLTTIEINAFIGDVQIYVPYDLEVDVQGHVMIGDMNGVTRNKGGRDHQDSTLGHRDDTKQIQIVASLFIGDIDVRYV